MWAMCCLARSRDLTRRPIFGYPLGHQGRESGKLGSRYVPIGKLVRRLWTASPNRDTGSVAPDGNRFTSAQGTHLIGLFSKLQAYLFITPCGPGPPIYAAFNADAVRGRRLIRP